MAEFQEVMKQWRRMCNKMREHGDWCQYSKCPLSGKCQLPSTTDIAETEGVVMQWAAEHPEPVYPTWREWLTSIGVIDQMFTHSVIADTLSMTPIPADIAEKLGIEPKGV